MSETENKINITSLLKKDLKIFSNEIVNLNKETLQQIMTILLDWKKNPKAFAELYWPNIWINQRAIKVAVALTDTKKWVNAAVEKNRS